MFYDVLECLCHAHHVDAVAVVTADPRLLELATRMGAHWRSTKSSPRGLNAASALGTKSLSRARSDAVLIVLSDLPLVTVEEIDSLLAMFRPDHTCDWHDRTKASGRTRCCARLPR